jgi:hypothetical protein
MKLSIPKPTSEMLPAIAPATMATKPSKAFHAMVKYSSLRPWCTTAVRSKAAISAMSRVYNAPGRTRVRRTCIKGRAESWSEPGPSRIRRTLFRLL